MLVHIANDEKFIDGAIQNFEAEIPRGNRLLITGPRRELKHVRWPQAEFADQTTIQRILAQPEVKGIVLHSMTWLARLALKFAPDKVPISWIGWGFDYYTKLLGMPTGNQLLLPKTVEANRQSINKWSPAILLKRLELVWYHWNGRLVNLNQSLVNRVQFFSPVLQAEYDTISTNSPWFTPQYVAWNYGLQLERSQSENGIPPGENVLIGNSATSTNNHLEIIDLLAQSETGRKRKIYCPLSYGSDQYRNLVAQYGQSQLGDAFVPLIEFMPFAEYQKILNSCGYIFMNHLRQQALGNIALALVNGAKLFIQERNPLSRWLGDIGAHFGLVPATGYAGLDTEVFRPLTEAQRTKNAQVMIDHYSSAQQASRTRELCHRLLHQ